MKSRINLQSFESLSFPVAVQPAGRQTAGDSQGDLGARVSPATVVLPLPAPVPPALWIIPHGVLRLTAGWQPTGTGVASR